MNSVHETLERRHYQLLLAFRDTRHLGQAAESLSISPSAASHRLREAEKRLGIKLVEPAGRSLRLTNAGARLAEAAAASEASLRAGEEASRWLASEARPTVRVALDFFDRAPWFYRYGGFSEFSFRVDLIRVAYGTSALAVSRRVADIGVRAVTELSIDSEPLGQDELAAAVPSDHPAARRGTFLPEDVTTLPYMTAGEPEPGFEFERFLEPAGSFPTDLVMIESISAILQLVTAGRGLTIQPSQALIPPFPGYKVLPLQGVTIPILWEALTRPEPSDNVSTLIDAMKADPFYPEVTEHDT